MKGARHGAAAGTRARGVERTVLDTNRKRQGKRAWEGETEKEMYKQQESLGERNRARDVKTRDTR